MRKLSSLYLIALLIISNLLLSTSLPAQRIATGRSHSLALCNDSSVMVWGDNSFGQLSDSSLTTSSLPVKVSTLSGIIAIASGEAHALAIKRDGTVWAWGSNLYGMLGNGTTSTTGCYCQYKPITVSGLTGAIMVAAGIGHSLALKNDSTVWAWGLNASGELGDGTLVNNYISSKVSVLSGIVAIAAGGHHSLALKKDGSVWAWGYNDAGQLGDSTLTTKPTPFKITRLSGVKAIAAGWEFSIALKDDSTVWTWGYNAYGQLGDSTITDRWVPGKVPGLTRIVAIASGSNHCFALKSDGTVWAWGWNTNGQLGNGTIINIQYPVKVSGLTGVTAIAGNYSGYAHSLALKGDGTMWSWGYNTWGQLGDGTKINRNTPVKVLSLCAMPSGIQNSELPGQNIKIYPNPFHSSLFIETELTNNSEFVLYDLLGNEVRKTTLITNKTEMRREDLATGMYLFQLRNVGICIKKGKVVID